MSGNKYQVGVGNAPANIPTLLPEWKTATALKARNNRKPPAYARFLYTTALSTVLVGVAPQQVKAAACQSPIAESCTNSGVYNGELNTQDGATIGSIVNTGTITGSDYGIYNNNANIGTILSAGSISGSEYDIYNNTGTVGVVINAGLASTADDETISVSSGETITNHTISIFTNGYLDHTVDAGIYNNASGVSIINDGTIRSDWNSRVTIQNSQSVWGNIVGIYNDGSINTITNNSDGSLTSIYNNSGAISSFMNNGEVNSAIFNALGSFGTITNNNAMDGVIFNIGGNIGAIINAGAGNIGNGIINWSGTIDYLENSGNISGPSDGVQNNQGTIGALINTGIMSGGTYGIENNQGFIDTLASSGMISGSEYEVYNNGGTINSLVNAGIILANGENLTLAAGSTPTSNGFSVENDGTIINLIEAGLYNNAPGTTILNNSTIFAANNITISGPGEGPFNIVNAGIYNVGGIDTLINTGQISADTNGIVNSGSIDVFNNSGTVYGESFGLEIDSGFIGTLINTGVIDGANTDFGVRGGIYNNFGTIGLLVNAGASISNSERLSIHPGQTLMPPPLYVVGFGTTSNVVEAGVYNAAANGAITNDGTIVNSVNFYLDPSSITNSAVYAGIYNSGTLSSITNNNSGNISGIEFDNRREIYGIYNDGSILTINNGGIINGQSYSIVNNTGTIGLLSNSGTISSDYVSVYNGNGTLGTLVNSAVISGMIENDQNGAIGEIDNSGTISGQNAAIFDIEGNIGTINNSGTLDGQGIGVVTTAGTIGAVNNDGVISGWVGTAEGTIGSINNSGTITGDVAAVYNYAGTIGTLNNSGIISGGVLNHFDESATTDAASFGTITNSGLITGESYALYNDGTLGPVINSGTIAGDIVNYSASPLVISGGENAMIGVLTGYDGSTGTIYSPLTGADIVFASGNLLLNDDIEASGGAITNSGATLLVNGAISADSSFSVTGGVLEVGDAANSGAALTDASGISISGTGMLRGHGTVIGDVSNSGTVYPGGSIGTLTVNGNYTQTDAGTLETEIAADGQADLLAVTGSASLAGGLDVNIDNGSYSVGTVYTILTASNGVTGNFISTNFNTSSALGAYITPQVIFGANNVQLELAPTPAVPNTPNNGESGGSDGPGTNAGSAGNSGSPTGPSEFTQAPAFRTGRFYVASTYTQNIALQNVLGAPFGYEADTNQTDKGYWMHGIGGFGNANGYNFNSKGFVAGKGFTISSHLTIGGGISNVYTSTTGTGSSVNGTSFGGLLYGIYNADRIAISADAAVGHLANDLNRYLPGLGWHGKSSSNGFYEGAEALVQYSLLNEPNVFLTPYAQASYLYTSLGSAQESNAGILNLRYDAMHTSLGQLGAGLTGGYKQPVNYGTLTLWARMGGFGTLGNAHASSTETLGTYRAKETALAAPVGAFTPGVGISLIGNGPWQLGASWNGQFSSTANTQNFALQASYRW